MSSTKWIRQLPNSEIEKLLAKEIDSETRKLLNAEVERRNKGKK